MGTASNVQKIDMAYNLSDMGLLAKRVMRLRLTRDKWKAPEIARKNNILYLRRQRECKSGLLQNAFNELRVFGQSFEPTGMIAK